VPSLVFALPGRDAGGEEHGLGETGFSCASVGDDTQGSQILDPFAHEHSLTRGGACVIPPCRHFLPSRCAALRQAPRRPGIPWKKSNEENYISGKRKVKEKFDGYFFIASFFCAVLINTFSALSQVRDNVEQALAQFLLYLKVERNASAHTVRTTTAIFAGSRLHAGEGRPDGRRRTDTAGPDEVGYLDVRAYLASLHRRNAKSSVARKLSALRSFFAYLVRQGVIRQNPAEMVAAPKMAQKIPEILPVDEAFRLMHGPRADAALAVGISPCSRCSTPAGSGWASSRR